MTDGASAQGLPASVTAPYQEYQAAIEAGDAAALLDAARRAYEAGEAARIDTLTLATLAENYGFAATANQRFDTAQDAWRDAARLSDRGNADPVDRAWRWHNAATIALQNSDNDDAYACSRNAVQALEELDGDYSEASDFAADAFLTRSMLAMGRGRISDSGAAALQAIGLFERHLDAPDTRYGLALLYAGVSQTLDQEFELATYSLHMARDVLSDVSPGHSNAATLQAALTSARLNLYHDDEAETEAAFARLYDRLAANRFHAERYSEPEDVRPVAEQAEAEERPCCDAQSLVRREPRYPEDALWSDLDGVVYVRFDVTAEGRTDNVEVIGAFPPGVFDQASIRAVRNWRYAPATRDGEPVSRENVETRFDFRIAR